MTKKLMLILTILVSPYSFYAVSAETDDRYISDNISVYLRRGPGLQYGLVGSLKTGDKVSILEKNQDGSFTKIKDEKNRTAWIESELLTNVASAKERLPELEQQILTLNETVTNAEQEKQSLIEDYSNQLDIARNKISKLETLKTDLEKQLEEKNAIVETLNSQLEENDQNVMLTWFTRGGIVAGSGLILGLLLPYITPRRRRKDRWMN